MMLKILIILVFLILSRYSAQNVDKSDTRVATFFTYDEELDDFVSYRRISYGYNKPQSIKGKIIVLYVNAISYQLRSFD